MSLFKVWGETDCFVQYRFPVQNLMRNFEDSSDETDSIDEVDQGWPLKSIYLKF